MKRYPLSLFLCAVVLSACQPTESLFELCDDLIDNNQDGLRDCADPQCAGDAVCPPETEFFCEDEEDNDLDGDTDCGDSDCAAAFNCMCRVSFGIFADQLPLVIEGDSSDGVEAINVLDCQEDGAIEDFIHLDFIGIEGIIAEVESLDGVEMVLQTSDDCSPPDGSVSVSCSPDASLSKDVSNGKSLLFFVGARRAGEAGRYRLHIRAAAN
jgi:hypothetical protein